MDGGDFPVMQDHSGFNLEACLLQQAMMRASGRPLSSFTPRDRELARAVARAGRRAELDVANFKF